MRRSDLAPGFDVPIDVVRQLVQDDVEVSRQFGRGEHADVVVREGLRVGGGGRGEGVAGLDAIDHVQVPLS